MQVQPWGSFFGFLFIRFMSFCTATASSTAASATPSTASTASSISLALDLRWNQLILFFGMIVYSIDFVADLIFVFVGHG